MPPYVIHPGCGETVMIHVLKRLDERDLTESFLDIDDVGSGLRICALPRSCRPERAERS